MQQLVISTISASVFGLFFLFLTTLVFMRRRQIIVALGDGGDLTLLRRQRAQGNFVEWAPLVLILLILTELGNFYAPFNDYFAATMAMVFFIGRICHAFSLVHHEKYDESLKIQSNPVFRVFGMVLSITAILLLSIWNLTAALSALSL
jgi:hypothetical protein